MRANFRSTGSSHHGTPGLGFYVAAVIVTRDRLALLQRALEGVKAQSRRPDHIIVVDNGSSDGTGGWLEAQAGIEVIRQSNAGSAGGFATGLDRAVDAGAEWIWLMDDDGIPGVFQLEELIRAGEETGAGIIGPAVVHLGDDDKLAFNQSGFQKRSQALAEWKRTLLEEHISFNGMLVRRTTPQRVGGIKREMFIWGDDVEYSRRATRAGIKVGWWPESLHRHPPVRRTYIPMPAFRCMLAAIPDESRRLIYYRNLAYVALRHGERPQLVVSVIKQVIYHCFYERANLRAVGRLFDYLLDGALDTYRLAPSRRELLRASSEHSVVS